MSSLPENARGFVQIESRHSAADTGNRLKALLKARGIMVFARVDFSADAERSGLSLPPEQLLIFGNPKAGTPLMLQQPTVGLDLPLKALIWQDVHGRCWVAYNDPAYIVGRHGLPSTFSPNLAAVVPLIDTAAAE